jgi:nucleoside-diphosphate-sugar epimerase
LSPYAASKFENESQIAEARKNGLKATALRFFNVYGIGQRPDGAYAAVIPKFADMMAQGISPRFER